MGLKKPFLIAHDGTHIYPDAAPETGGVMDTKSREAYTHVAASGKMVTYLVGRRAFKRVDFPWQTGDLKTEWESFWQLIDGGKSFYYCDDASIPICGDGTEAGDGSVCGQTTANVAVVSTLMVCDQDDISFEDEEAWDYYSVSLQMREAV